MGPGYHGLDVEPSMIDFFVLYILSMLLLLCGGEEPRGLKDFFFLELKQIYIYIWLILKSF